MVRDNDYRPPIIAALSATYFPLHRFPPWVVLAALALTALAALALALTAGSVDIGVGAVTRALFWPADDASASNAVVRELRLPRAMAGFAVGALLALAGTMMQVLLRNPLADPYVLGLSGGAACGALTALLAGAAALVTPAAFAGALVSTFVVFGWCLVQLLRAAKNHERARGASARSARRAGRDTGAERPAASKSRAS